MHCPTKKWYGIDAGRGYEAKVLLAGTTRGKQVFSQPTKVDKLPAAIYM